MLHLVAEVFEDKFDKQGIPYFLHCLYVMQNCGLIDEDELCIALGHDLIEDIKWINYEYLKNNFNEKIAHGISCLTNLGNYDSYIKNIGIVSTTFPYIAKIKLTDLTHNMMASRLKGLTKKDFDRMEKYMRAYTYLKSI